MLFDLIDKYCTKDQLRDFFKVYIVQKGLTINLIYISQIIKHFAAMKDRNMKDRSKTVIIL